MKPSARYASIDILRGILMVLMALDHAMLFIARQHSPGEYWGGSFPSYSSALPFITRAITHLCAPGFFFLMGTGMALFAISRSRSGWSYIRITSHFIGRGLLLIILEFTIIAWGWQLAPGGWVLKQYFGVMAALGSTMVITSIIAGLLSLPSRRKALAIAATVLGCLLPVLANLSMPSINDWNKIQPMLSRLFLVPGGDLNFWLQYPILPWLGLVFLGLAFGVLMYHNKSLAYRIIAISGALFLVLFIAIRGLNGFGNLRPRSGASWIDWLNVVKYPPELAFTLLTLGIDMLLLAGIGWLIEKNQTCKSCKYLTLPFKQFGQTPLFFYVVHLYLYASIGHLLSPWVTTLPQTYMFCLVGLLILYPLCYGYQWLASYRVKQ